MQASSSSWFSPPMAGSDQGIATAFADRWRGPDDGYGVSADGIIRSVFPARHWAGRGGSAPLMAEILAGAEESQFDQQNDIGAAPRECGPSPMNSFEIARAVVAAADKHGVDPEFALAVAMAESRLDRRRNSPKGARGPMQLMPETAERFGVRDICDPVSNIDGGVRFLRDLFDRLDNPLLVAAAYNAGEARVREYGGIPPFPETLAFVAEVINRQIGSPGTNSRDRASATGSESPIDDSDPPAGVITRAQRRQWVGGVMQF